MDIPGWIPREGDFRRLAPSAPQVRERLVILLFVILVSIVVAGLVGVSLIILGVYITIPTAVQIDQLLSLIGSLFLSAALVYLYFQQKQILASEHRSRLGINRFIGGDDDVVNLLLSNSGSGAIHNVYLLVEVEYKNSELSGGMNQLQLSTTDEEGNKMRFVPPYQSEISYTKKMLLPVQFPNGPDYGLVPFHLAMSFADNFDTTEGHLTLTLMWEDTLQVEEAEIFDEDIEISRGQNFEEFISLFPEHYRAS